MCKAVILAAVTFASAVCGASEASLKAIGLETTDDSGCYITNGEFVAPTIGLMVSAYDDPAIRNDVVIAIIEVAIAAGCDISEADSVGLSPLNAAILFNQPKLVKLLLERGANPERPIVSSRESLNGKNSYQLIDYLVSKGKDLAEVRGLVEENHQKR